MALIALTVVVFAILFYYVPKGVEKELANDEEVIELEIDVLEAEVALLEANLALVEGDPGKAVPDMPIFQAGDESQWDFSGDTIIGKYYHMDLGWEKTVGPFDTEEEAKESIDAIIAEFLKN